MLDARSWHAPAGGSIACPGRTQQLVDPDQTSRADLVDRGQLSGSGLRSSPASIYWGPIISGPDATKMKSYPGLLSMSLISQVTGYMLKPENGSLELIPSASQQT